MHHTSLRKVGGSVMLTIPLSDAAAAHLDSEQST
jgi:hypothetical protein